ncbi:hypothetical protein D9756_006912 [Leucocoprinus leucothites]|uniref:Uncharacterized protein n=1 Tax=Leucocoprinus leucothites TaxID=201217 RepID=A0A8H5D5J8_9AGAR|nr:hypothetical protein D9756_006912 [Leucoagaricus leucothites]
MTSSDNNLQLDIQLHLPPRSIRRKDFIPRCLSDISIELWSDRCNTGDPRSISDILTTTIRIALSSPAPLFTCSSICILVPSNRHLYLVLTESKTYRILAAFVSVGETTSPVSPVWYRRLPLAHRRLRWDPAAILGDNPSVQQSPCYLASKNAAVDASERFILSVSCPDDDRSHREWYGFGGELVDYFEGASESDKVEEAVVERCCSECGLAAVSIESQLLMLQTGTIIPIKADWEPSPTEPSVPKKRAREDQKVGQSTTIHKNDNPVDKNNNPSDKPPRSTEGVEEEPGSGVRWCYLRATSSSLLFCCLGSILHPECLHE